MTTGNAAGSGPVEFNMEEIEEEVVLRCMLQNGCTEGEARQAYARFFREVWAPACELLSEMLVRRETRNGTGKDDIWKN